MTRHAIAYISFDRVPAPKGASTHIEAFTRMLGSAFGGVHLVSVAEGLQATSIVLRWPGVMQTELPAIGASLIDRVLCFRQYLGRWLRTAGSVEIFHFRSIFEGLPLVKLSQPRRRVFEVNGLPSIELKYRYPRIVDDRELMRKLLRQEQVCLEAADLIVTPSQVTKDFLVGARAVNSSNIRVIPNGVDLDVFRPRASADAERTAPMRLLYFGTLAAWQGVDLAVRAVAVLNRHIAATLIVFGAANRQQQDSLAALASKLGAGDRVKILPPVDQETLAGHLRSADAVVAPLIPNDRNAVQGCCPLKILESMAAGVPVIASDLPVVRELGNDGEHFLLVKPGSVDEIASAAIRLNEEAALREKISLNARRRVEQHYTWTHAGDSLLDAYEELGMRRSITA